MSKTATARAESKVQKPGWKVLLLLGAAGVGAVMFLYIAALPYFALDPQKLGLYAGKEPWVFAHITAGMVALLLGPFVLWLGLNRRKMPLHRQIGVAYMISVALSSIAAYYLAFTTNLGWVFGMGLTALATAWIATTSLAFVSIRRRMVDQHKEWMIRSYVTTFSFVNFRIFVGILMSAGVGTQGEQLTAASWICWSVPLLVTELILQGRKVLRPAKISS